MIASVLFNALQRECEEVNMLPTRARVSHHQFTKSPIHQFQAKGSLWLS